jgi:site-specific DNA-adenine methylase
VINYKSIIAVLCSILVLTTSVGAVVYQHYCGEMAKEVSLTKIDKHCLDHQKTMACHHSNDDKDCCKTEKKNLTTSEKHVKQSEDFTVANRGSQFVTVFYVLVQYLFTNPFEVGNNQSVSKVVSDPPPSEISFLVNYQTFLI